MRRAPQVNRDVAQSEDWVSDNLETGKGVDTLVITPLSEDEPRAIAPVIASSTSTKSLQTVGWLVLWMVNNVGVTLLNKSAFQFADFNYPYMLSAIHMAFNAIGMQFFFRLSPFFGGSSIKRKVLNTRGLQIIVAFSVIFSANVAVGNASLRYVTVNFNQVMRSLVPGVVMLIGIPLLKKTYSLQQRLSLIPVIVGVMLACMGEIHFTNLGFIITVLCVILAALKVIISSMVLTGDMKLHPIDLLARMCPFACVEVLIVSYLTGEVESILGRWGELRASGAVYLVVFSALSSVTLNITSLYANKMTSALTLAVAANVKQVLMIAIATVLFGTPISVLNGSGIFVVLAGSARYSYVVYTESQRGRGT